MFLSKPEIKIFLKSRSVIVTNFAELLQEPCLNGSTIDLCTQVPLTFICWHQHPFGKVTLLNIKLTYNLNEIVSNLSNFNGISIQGAIKFLSFTEKISSNEQSLIKFGEVKSI